MGWGGSSLVSPRCRSQRGQRVYLVRDTLQIISIGISLMTLGVIAYKIRRNRQSWRIWSPVIIISILTIVYYLAVLYDLYVKDIMNAGDVSSTLRLTVQITILLYVWYMPPRRRGE
jgi:hypothetical protein